jgi:MFS family permease
MSAVAEQLRESASSFGDVLKNRNLRRVNLALTGSVIGDWAYSIAIAVWAYREGGATAVGLFGVVRYVTMAFVGPLLAALADRYPKKLVMIGADVARAALVFGAVALIALDGPSLAVYALALVTAWTGQAFRPAQAALLPSLATNPQELTGANVVAATIESVGFFLGPAIAGLLLGVADVEIVLAFNAMTFVWSAAMLTGLPRASSTTGGDALDRAVVDEGEDERAGMVADLTAGFWVIARNPHLRLITILYTAQTVVAGASVVFGVTIALELLDLGESGVGVLDAVLGVGGLIGSVLAMGLASRQRLASDFGVGVVLWSAPLLLIAASPTLIPALAAMFLIGVGNSLVDINAYTILQRMAPADVMGRVFGALESIAIGGMALGAVLMPVLIELVGVRGGLLIIGAAVAVVAVAGFAGLRRIDATLLAPPGLALLRAVPTLAALPPPVLERLAQSLVPRTVTPGEDVFREGDHGDMFWVIQRGKAVVTSGGSFLSELTAGDSFGEIALLRDVPRTATVSAATDSELVLYGIERDDFIGAVTGHGDAAEVADAVVERWLSLS